ncbi:Histone-lysine N-methyltransferase ASHR2 [Fusarium oxysporum f. sp. cubense]|uniref:Histone-lysine N-methyltransferase ASHR2 n=1 Tax=Fusarium oxysporum f. sp. cubense TaxID=61366 RepID=A0A559L4I5_FUSOC|nr:Histone-lysine N-methyltransferase ASHR2 [Fusarium oxysporum f. sp. cubense]
MEFQKPRLPPKAPRSTPKPSNVVTHDLEFYVHPNLVPDQDPCKGRLLRAAGPIREGTVLLVDTPYAIVPSVTSNEPLICSNLSCSRRVPQNGRAVRCEHACSKDVVWCNVACRATDKARHDFECSWLKKHAEPLRQKEGEYNFATVWHVVRLLATWNAESHSGNALVQQRHPWEAHFLRGWKAVDMCCAYLDSWPEVQIIHWKRLVHEYLSDATVLPPLLSAEQMLLLLCKEETNTFGLYPRATGSQPVNDNAAPRGESYGMALYPRAAQFNHSCLPNVTHKPDGQARMVYTAARDISKGEECMITYFDLTTHKDLTSRQNHTQEQFQFKCTCERCLKEEAEENIECMVSLPFGF